MMKETAVGESEKITDREGLILQDCGGDLREWEDSINELLIKSDTLPEGDTFESAYVFENEGLTNLLLDMDDAKLDVGKLAMWRISTHQQSSGTQLSDYPASKFEVEKKLKSSMESEL